MEIENVEIVCNVDDENSILEGCVDFLDVVTSLPFLNNSVIVCQTGEVFNIQDIATARSVLYGLAYGFSIKSKNQKSDE